MKVFLLWCGTQENTLHVVEFHGAVVGKFLSISFPIDTLEAELLSHSLHQ